MTLKKPDITSISKIIYEKLTRENLITVKTSESSILETIQQVLLEDVQQEEAILKEAEKMMEKFKSQVQSGEIDYEKMFGMIKKQLIKEKNFIV